MYQYANLCNQEVCNVDQTFCHLAPQDYRFPNSRSSGSIRLLLNRAPLFTQFRKFTQLFIGKLKADSVSIQTLKVNAELSFYMSIVIPEDSLDKSNKGFANSQ